MNRNMKYRDFDGFKINEGKIMNTTNFSDFEMIGDHECEYSIFKLFPKHCFAIVLKSGRVYVYDNKGQRIKHWDVETLSKAEGIDATKFSILATPNGQFIKEQYEDKSGLTVVDVIQFMKKTKEDSKRKKRRVRKEWEFDEEGQGQGERLFNLGDKPEDDEDKVAL